MKHLLFVFACAFYAHSLFARAPLFPLKGNESKFYLWSLTEYYWSSENYDSNGNPAGDLPFGNTFTNIKQFLQAQYLFYPRLSAFTSLEYSYVESVSRDVAGMNNDTRVSRAFSDWLAGVQYHLVSSPFHFTPEFFLIMPLNTVSPSSDNAVIGDGTFKYAVGAWFEKRVSVFHMFARLGASFDTGDLADRMYWRLGARSFFAKIFHGGFGLWGYTSIGKDVHSDDPSQRFSYLLKVNAGSLKYYSIEPELSGYHAWVGARLFNAWYFILGYEGSFAGKNTALGQSVTFQVQFKGKSKKKKKDPRLEHNIDFGDGFQIEKEELPPDLISD